MRAAPKRGSMLGLQSLGRRLFGSANDRKLRSYLARVEKINALEAQFQALDDAALRDVTPALKARLADGEKLDGVLEEAFAAVREAARRTLANAIMMCSLSAAWLCMTAKSPK